ncbi:mitochondrial dynamin GTPase Msp1 [Friedmanniomyces endolithicus]|nr:mitochondrial dynamin GTPase Msp1 [Friedmanniomyces endolithicus]KAK0788957.1 mitochondrial dynamin GTPase Msp1 [Friedmanniomyces endolithicus]KAK0874467.1 mitochondrial dynamin GTPase Msp1 [Friedmanniomyces endolithicus]KAK0918213.1 mitochondrial dynamin GTPase Msp1 [Friedmanniomyces endolithicus]KAK0982269.1 mitochondrial dynamin GTPase Msp1 [Friedmanniomyces endolithicus]
MAEEDIGGTRRRRDCHFGLGIFICATWRKLHQFITTTSINIWLTMALGDRKTLLSYLPEVLLGLATPILALYLCQQALKQLDPDAGAKADAQQKARAASSRLQSIFSNTHEPTTEDDRYDDEDKSSDEDEDGRPNNPRRKKQHPQEPLVLTPFEQTIAMEVVRPTDIPVTFTDIGGLDALIDDLRESIIYPLTLPHLYASHSSLLAAPSGVLLYGPPGCGKTMLAKALARESGACFINLHISTLTEKWYGDSNKLVAAVFSLARKLQPCIVFIDEIDAVLGQRRSGEHEASGMVKAEFMTHWDGLASTTTEEGSQRICILGATNRIQDIDEAILRRMPKKFAVGLPNARQRRQIFELTLRDTRIDRGASALGAAPAFDLTTLVRLSAGMSGSDIKEACRDAAMVPVREYIKSAKAKLGGGGGNVKGIKGAAVRGLQTDDFFGRRKVESQRRESEEPKTPESGRTEEVEEFQDEEGVEEVERR